MGNDQGMGQIDDSVEDAHELTQSAKESSSKTPAAQKPIQSTRNPPTSSVPPPNRRVNAYQAQNNKMPLVSRGQVVYPQMSASRAANVSANRSRPTIANQQAFQQIGNPKERVGGVGAIEDERLVSFATQHNEALSMRQDNRMQPNSYSYYAPGERQMAHAQRFGEEDYAESEQEAERHTETDGLKNEAEKEYQPELRRKIQPEVNMEARKERRKEVQTEMKRENLLKQRKEVGEVTQTESRRVDPLKTKEEKKITFKEANLEAKKDIRENAVALDKAKKEKMEDTKRDNSKISRESRKETSTKIKREAESATSNRTTKIEKSKSNISKDGKEEYENVSKEKGKSMQAKELINEYKILNKRETTKEMKNEKKLVQKNDTIRSEHRQSNIGRAEVEPDLPENTDGIKTDSAKNETSHNRDITHKETHLIKDIGDEDAGKEKRVKEKAFSVQQEQKMKSETPKDVVRESNVNQSRKERQSDGIQDEDLLMKKKIESGLFASRRKSQQADEPEMLSQKRSMQEGVTFKVKEDPALRDAYLVKKSKDAASMQESISKAERQSQIEDSELLQKMLETKILENESMKLLIEKQVQEEIKRLKLLQSNKESGSSNSQRSFAKEKELQEELVSQRRLEIQQREREEKIRLEHLEAQRTEYETKYKELAAEQRKFEESQKGVQQMVPAEINRKERLLLEKQRAQEEIRRKFQSEFFPPPEPLGAPPKELEGKVKGRMVNRYEYDEITDDLSLEPYRFNKGSLYSTAGEAAQLANEPQSFYSSIYEYRKGISSDLKRGNKAEDISVDESIMRIPNLLHTRVKDRITASSFLHIPLLCLNYPESNGTYGLLYAEVNDYDKAMQVKSIIAKEFIVHPKAIRLYHKGSELTDEVVLSKVQYEGEILCFSVTPQPKKSKADVPFER